MRVVSRSTKAPGPVPFGVPKALGRSSVDMKLAYIETVIILLNISYYFKAKLLLHMGSPGYIYEFGTENVIWQEKLTFSSFGNILVHLGPCETILTHFEPKLGMKLHPHPLGPPPGLNLQQRRLRHRVFNFA